MSECVSTEGAGGEGGKECRHKQGYAIAGNSLSLFQPEGSWVRTEQERTAVVLREKVNGIKTGVD